MESNPKYRVWFDEVHGILKAVIKERFEVDDVDRREVENKTIR